MTNFERIKAMSVEEMASFLFTFGTPEVCRYATDAECRECAVQGLCDCVSPLEYERWIESEVHE